MKRVARRTLSVAVVATVSVAGCAELQPETGERLAACSDADSDPTRTVSFKDQIRPLLDNEVPGTKGCVTCHYPEGTTREGIEAVRLTLMPLGELRKGGASSAGRIVIPGKPCDSALVQKLRGTFPNGARMPKGGPFWEPAQIQLVIDWIAEGANGEDAD